MACVRRQTKADRSRPGFWGLCGAVGPRCWSAPRCRRPHCGFGAPRPRAQPAPNARPGGGVVTGGSATISDHQQHHDDQPVHPARRDQLAAASTSAASRRVDFEQPSATAVALNRVISPNPSQIAGRIDANGQIILINQSGVIFYKGAQVNTAGLMVSAAGISDHELHGRQAGVRPGGAAERGGGEPGDDHGQAGGAGGAGGAAGGQFAG